MRQLIWPRYTKVHQLRSTFISLFVANAAIIATFQSWLSSPPSSSSTKHSNVYEEVKEDDDPRISNYVNLLVREIKATRTDFDTNPNIETVFFGGGTPSLVPPKLVSLILDTLSSNFGLRPDAEISMEMDPGTFGAQKLKELMDLGVNRVSLGVQAFQDELLKACGRAHGVSQVY